MNATFVPAITPPVGLSQPAFYFLFQGARLLVAEDSQTTTVPRLRSPADLELAVVRHQYLGYLQGDGGPDVTHCFSGELGEGVSAPEGTRFENLRALYSRLDETLFRVAGRAVQIVDWDRTHQFCGRCGSPTVNQVQDRSKICPACRLTNYPRLAPAVIVRVERRDEGVPRILLARAQRFPTAMFSVLAGFVEPGETLEECVQREICEEVRLQVKNIRYFGGQPWPFPRSLVLACGGEYGGGEIELDESELAEAGWFAADALPTFPPPPSIANRLITTWLAELATSP